MARGFGSDNHSGVHPRIFAALQKANTGHVPSYGADPITEDANILMRSLFGDKTATFFVFNGTAANVLALSSIVRPHHAVLASQHAHLLNDECGAPERNLHCKFVSIPSSDAKLTPDLLRPYVARLGDQHASQVRAVSITQSTELGTLYTVEEMRAISAFCREHRLLLHMDGARLVSAVAALGCTFQEMTTDAGVDVLSLGGTKHGLIFGEAVLLLNPEATFGVEEMKYVRKQLMQLSSKTRFIASQFIELLGTELWRENATRANQLAQELSQGLAKIPGVRLTQKTECNAVFVEIPRAWVGPLSERSFFYVWNERTCECRFMTSWDTTREDVEGFIAAVQGLAG
jgi:threonine aldolase